MRHLYQSIILSGFLFSSNAQAMEFFADALYWKASETVDWVLTNSRTTVNQNITYKTIDFNFDPGFRVGVGFDDDFEDDWDVKFYYTKYYTNTTAATTGNIVAGFLAGKLAQASNDYFYQAGHIDFKINLNMFDLDFGKSFYVTEIFMLHPIVGLRGGWIDQTLNTSLTGPLSIEENIKHNFHGIGPKTGIGTKITLADSENYQFNFVADFTASYLWGKWTIKDVLTENAPQSIEIDVGSRNFGSLALQAFTGIDLAYQEFSIILGYEINDWFNQCQIFDDATGAHDNDLILQGLTLRLAYDF